MQKITVRRRGDVKDDPHKHTRAEMASKADLDEVVKIQRQWYALRAKFEATERSNEALRAHVQDLLEVLLKLNRSVVAWKCATGFFAIMLIAVVIASLYI